MGDLLAIPFLIVLFAVIFIVNRRSAKRTVAETTRTVSGTIRDTDNATEIDGDGHRQHKYFWIIEYRIDDTVYKLRQEASGISYSQMIGHIGETVTVHYVPSRRYKAWASVPGRSMVNNMSASGTRIS